MSLISVPFIVFFPAYSIHFFAGRYAKLGALIDPPLAAPIEGTAAAATGTVAIIFEDIAWDDLPEHLQKIFLQRSDRIAFAKGDDDVYFQYVTDVIDIARNSGLDRVGLIGKQ